MKKMELSTKACTWFLMIEYSNCHYLIVVLPTGEDLSVVSRLGLQQNVFIAEKLYRIACELVYDCGKYR